MRSYVYFIRQADTGFIKIGRAVDPERRIHNIQVGSPQELKLLGAVLEFGAFDEGGIHDAFTVHHFRGEWFQERGSLAAVVRDHLPWFIEQTRRSDGGMEIDKPQWCAKFVSLLATARSDEELKLYKACLDCGERKHYRHFYFREKTPLSYCKPCQRERSTQQRMRKLMAEVPAAESFLVRLANPVNVVTHG